MIGKRLLLKKSQERTGPIDKPFQQFCLKSIIGFWIKSIFITWIIVGFYEVSHEKRRSLKRKTGLR